MSLKNKNVQHGVNAQTIKSIPSLVSKVASSAHLMADPSLALVPQTCPLIEAHLPASLGRSDWLRRTLQKGECNIHTYYNLERKTE